MAHLIGSVQKGKMADLVLWNPAFFGAKPDLIIKGGQIAWAQMGMICIDWLLFNVTRTVLQLYSVDLTGNNQLIFMSVIYHNNV